MTKQTQAEPEEVQSIDLLYKSYNSINESVEKVKAANITAGLDSKHMDEFISWQEPFGRRKYERWVSAVTHPRKKGRFYQIAELKDDGLIPYEPSEHDDKTYPYRKLNSIMRVKTPDGKEWIERHERWYGLTKAGQILSMSVNNLDYYTRVNVVYDYVPKEPADPSGESIRVGRIKSFYNIEQPGQPRTYITPYSKEKVDEFLKYADHMDSDGNGAETSLLLIKVGRYIIKMC